MGLFSVNYQNVPGQCVYAQGGLKFRTDEECLSRYFAPILSYVSLNDLIGEAVFWSLVPTSMVVWAFPFILYYNGISSAIITAVIVFLIAEIYHLFFYNKPINYLVFFLANPLPKIILYAIFVAIFILSGSTTKTVVLAVWLLGSFFGVNEVLTVIVYVSFAFIGRAFFKKTKEFLLLPASDQILRNIGWYYARKFGIDPTKWQMYD